MVTRESEQDELGEQRETLVTGAGGERMGTQCSSDRLEQVGNSALGLSPTRSC